jgi:anti-sigma regulatory factor (Ser/Thr protein kinase)
MHGQTSIAFQASAGGHARHSGTTRQPAPPAGPGPRPPGNPVRIPALSDPHGNDVTGRWPLASFLELGALPSAVPCARLHTRQLLWEWQLTGLADSAELIVSELMTNAIQASRADRRTAPVRLWLLADRTSLLILVWDASPLPPVRMNTSDDAENGRGLLLVETLSTRWDFFAHHQGGKVVWASLEALLQMQHFRGIRSRNRLTGVAMRLDTGDDDPRYLVHWPGRLRGVVLCSDLGRRTGTDSRVHEPHVTSR